LGPTRISDGRIPAASFLSALARLRLGKVLRSVTIKWEASVYRNWISKVSATAAFALVMAGGALAPAQAAGIPESTDPIKLAINEWTGQHITTYVAGEVLKRMGYNVEYTTAGYLPQFEAIQDGTVTASLEIWSNNVGEAYDKAAATGKVVKLGDLGVVAGEAWYYPKYVEEKCPGLPD